MTAPIRFEDEADVEYREAGRWYESRRIGLGVEFFDAVDTALRHIVDFPRAGTPAPRVPKQLPVRRLAITRFPYHVVYLETPDALRILAIAHDQVTGRDASGNHPSPFLRQPNALALSRAAPGTIPPSVASAPAPVRPRA